MAAAVALSILQGCDQVRKLKLPEVEALKEDMRASIPQIDYVNVTYGNAACVVFDIGYGRNHAYLSKDDAFLIQQKVRELFMQEDFQTKLLEKVRGLPREDILEGKYRAADVMIYITDKSRSFEAKRYNYCFESTFFADRDNFNGGKGTIYDGYSTWRGYRYNSYSEEPEYLNLPE